MKSIHTLKMLFLGLISLLAFNPMMGQEKFNISVGLGHPELINFGLRYQMGQSQLGLSAGFFPSVIEDIYSFGADYHYHFAETSTLSARRTWYVRMGLYRYTVSNVFDTKKYLLLVPRLGKDFNLSPNLGIAADAGVSFLLSSNEEGIFDYMGGRNDLEISLGFSLFYRL